MEGGAVPTRSKWVHWGLEKEENWMGILGPGGPSFLTPPAAVPGGTAIAESRRGKPELAPGTWTDLRKPQAPFRESGRGNGVRGKVSDYHLPFQRWGRATCLGNTALLFSCDEPLPIPGTPRVRQGNR